MYLSSFTNEIQGIKPSDWGYASTRFDTLKSQLGLHVDNYPALNVQHFQDGIKHLQDNIIRSKVFELENYSLTKPTMSGFEMSVIKINDILGSDFIDKVNMNKKIDSVYGMTLVQG